MFSGPGAAGTRTALCNRALGPRVLAYKPHGWRQSPARADPAKMTNRPQHRRCALRAARCAGDSAPIGGSCGSHPRRLVRGSAKATTLLTSRFSFNNRHLYSGGASLKPSPPSTRAEIDRSDHVMDDSTCHSPTDSAWFHSTKLRVKGWHAVGPTHKLRMRMSAKGGNARRPRMSELLSHINGAEKRLVEVA